MYYQTYEPSPPMFIQETASFRTSASTNIFEDNTQHNNVIINGTVDDTPVKVLVDTGASVTVIARHFYHSTLSASSPVQVSQILQSIKTANGAQVPVEGIVTFNITLGQSIPATSVMLMLSLVWATLLYLDVTFLNKTKQLLTLGR